MDDKRDQFDDDILESREEIKRQMNSGKGTGRTENKAQITGNKEVTQGKGVVENKREASEKTTGAVEKTQVPVNKQVTSSSMESKVAGSGQKINETSSKNISADQEIEKTQVIGNKEVIEKNKVPEPWELMRDVVKANKGQSDIKGDEKLSLNLAEQILTEQRKASASRRARVSEAKEKIEIREFRSEKPALTAQKDQINNYGSKFQEGREWSYIDPAGVENSGIISEIVARDIDKLLSKV